MLIFLQFFTVNQVDFSVVVRIHVEDLFSLSHSLLPWTVHILIAQAACVPQVEMGKERERERKREREREREKERERERREKIESIG